MDYNFRQPPNANLSFGDESATQDINVPFWAQLTAYDGVQWYAWMEMQPLYGGRFQALDGARYGSITPTLVYPAYCAMQGTAVPITTSALGDPNGSYVKMERAYFDNGVNSTLQWVWVFWWPGPFQSVDVITDWECVDGMAVITKKRLTGYFIVSNP